jgi:CRISPR-associated protein Csm3
VYGKIKISADLEVLTGLHIGGSTVFSAIGSVDSPVIRDAATGLPIIPGSSLKGKLRTLLARSVSNSIVPNKSPDEDSPEIKRLFGGDKGKTKSRLQFVDAFLKNKEKFRETGVTEIKFENTINRMSGVANPRQIERVIRGCVFDFRVVYDIVKENEMLDDFENFAKALKLLTMDYLGGHGTRGYGRVRFKEFGIEVIEAELPEEITEKLLGKLKEVENNELLHV